MTMFRRTQQLLPALGVIFALLATLALPVRPAAAQTAYANPYRTTLAYMNLGVTTAQLTFTFTSVSGQVRNVTKSLASNAATFLTVVSATNTNQNIGVPGATENPATRKGSIVVSSTQRVIAVVVQTDSGTTRRTRNRLLTTGFTSESVDTTVYVPTYMRHNNSSQKMSSRLAIQNAASSTISYVARFYDMLSTTPVMTVSRSITSGRAAYLDAASIGTENVVGSLPAGFSGSVVITSTGSIVASVVEAQGATNPPTNQPANAQMAIPANQTATTMYAPSALCSIGGRSTTLAVQNAGSTTTSVTPVLNGVSTGLNGTQTEIITGTAVSVEPGVKKIVRVCDVLSEGTSGAQTTFNGALQLSSDTENIAVIAKEDGGGHSSAYEAQPAAAASDTLVAPYVRNAQASRYNNTSSGRLRSSIIIQNVGSTALEAGDVLVNYYDLRGRLIGTHTLGSAVPVGSSVTSNPGQMTLESTIDLAFNNTAAQLAQQNRLISNFGYVYVNNLDAPLINKLEDGEGGGAVITCAAEVTECDLLATVRVTGNNTATNNATTNNHAEMYNAVPSN